MTQNERPLGEWLEAFREINNPCKFVSPAQMAVLFSMATRANSQTGKGIFPSRRTVAADVGVDIKTVDKALKTAVKLNLFKKVRRGNSHGYASQYELVPPGKWRNHFGRRSDGTFEPFGG